MKTGIYVHLIDAVNESESDKSLGPFERVELEDGEFKADDKPLVDIHEYSYTTYVCTSRNQLYRRMVISVEPSEEG